MVEFRYAERKDVTLILWFIKQLASYEKLLDEVVADEQTLEEWMFDKNKAEVIFALEDGKEVGIALFFHNFSTFLGRSGIYLEDLFVIPEYRGKGYGKALLKRLAAIAVERKCGRLEWVCINWNQPSIDFYLSLGAKPMSEWTLYRVDGETLNQWSYVKKKYKLRMTFSGYFFLLVSTNYFECFLLQFFMIFFLILIRG